MDLTWIAIPTVKDPRGNLAFLQNSELPFDLKRVFYLFDVPSGSSRGGHALQHTHQIIVPLSGSFEVLLKTGKEETRVVLNNPTKGLLVPPMIWRELHHFSAGAVCLVLTSKEYDENDYIREWTSFTRIVSLR